MIALYTTQAYQSDICRGGKDYCTCHITRLLLGRFSFWHHKNTIKQVPHNLKRQEIMLMISFRIVIIMKVIQLQSLNTPQHTSFTVSILYLKYNRCLLKSFDL